MQLVNLKLHKPHVSFKETYLAGFEELETESDRSAWVYLGDSTPHDIPKQNFGTYVESLLKRETEAPSGFVTDTVYWAISDGEMVGRISLRHELNEFLRQIGGHIGYIVRPTFRRRGVATEMLRQLLKTPQAKSISKLLLTCDEDNLGSEKSILKNGGVFESILDLKGTRPNKKRFWISIN